ncbi:AbrB/MazE/SpoVT family DNA-binding domain-containing protein [Candidatus Woesearchaeota archaeon]|nr:AbrB/MazE/SpoVT family DNA-binding domain-containing protein [Candidatus Woesearchaeota archaeon]
MIIMSNVEFAKASSKGQVVIPQSIREKLGIEEGTPFAVWSSGNQILFKKMDLPQKSWEEVAAPFRRIAKERKLTFDDVEMAIRKVRSAKK